MVIDFLSRGVNDVFMLILAGEWCDRRLRTDVLYKTEYNVVIISIINNNIKNII